MLLTLVLPIFFIKFYMHEPTPSQSSIALEGVLKIIEPLVKWLLRTGVGYSEFAQALKKAFYLEAEKELERLNHKNTVSSLSLLAGLNRRDVSTFKDQQLKHIPHPCPSIAARVVTLWINKKWQKQIPFSGEEVSFETLSKKISQDKHPRSVLSELQRLGLVTEFDNTIILHCESFTPHNDIRENQKLLTQAAYDHLSAGVSNTFIHQNQFLEQNLQADELTFESIQQLKQYSHQLWQEYAEKMLNKAYELSERDQGKANAYYRFSLGIYQYDEEMENSDSNK